MATDALEIRMARLEGAYEQINVRLAGVEREIGGLRSEMKAESATVRSEFATVRSELAALRVELTTKIDSNGESLRRRMDTQFYWLLTILLGSILIPLLRDLLGR